MNLKQLEANLKSRIKKQSHLGLWRALYDLYRELDTLRRHCKGVRDARRYANAKALKLNVGCGSNYKTGWVNIDRSGRVDLQLDIRKPIPLPDESAQLIYSEHFLEHLDYPQDAKRFINESFRILSAGGTFSVGVPDTLWPLLDYVNEGQGRYFEFAKSLHPEWCKTRMEHINFHFRQGTEHRFAYDFETLEYLLKEGGFVEIRQREFDPDLDSNESCSLGTLYVDALKPNGENLRGLRGIKSAK
jgi:predicted SAM-dependent methyltransferase